MSHGRGVEVYTSFLKLSGALDGPAEERLTDLVAGAGSVLDLYDASVEPATEHHLPLSRGQSRLSVVKASIILVCPRDPVGETARHREAWREKQKMTVQLNAQAFSMLGEVHLEPGDSLEDHLCGQETFFVPVTGVSALWLAGAEPRAVQRGFALLNRAALVSFAPAPAR